jgi:hypothetical protein
MSCVNDQAYFANIAPLFPILDENRFYQQLHRFVEQGKPEDNLWLMLLKLMLCVGAASCCSQYTSNTSLKQLHETLFSQVVSSEYIAFDCLTLQNVQIVLLIVSKLMLLTMLIGN